MIDVFGGIGAVLVLLAYFRLSGRAFIDVDALAEYYGVSLTGGVLLLANAWFYDNLPFIFLNAAWITISLLQLNKIYLIKQEESEKDG